MIAMWNDEVIAHSTDTIRVEGHHYFPPDSVDWSALIASATTSRCWWKGKATYFHVRVNRRGEPRRRLDLPLAVRPADHRLRGVLAGVTVEP